MGLFDEVAGGILKNVLAGKPDKAGCWKSLPVFSRVPNLEAFRGLAETFNERAWRGNVLMDRQRRKPSHFCEQIQQVLGSGQNSTDLLKKSRVSTDDASSGLAEMLPQIVDKLTPEGSLPTQDLLHQGLGMIADKLSASDLGDSATQCLA